MDKAKKFSLTKWLQYCKIIDEANNPLQDSILFINCDDAAKMSGGCWMNAPEWRKRPKSGSMEKLWTFDTFYVEGQMKTMAIVYQEKDETRLIYRTGLSYHVLHSIEPFME